MISQVAKYVIYYICYTYYCYGETPQRLGPVNQL
jgi:hypothetical protein